MRKDKRKSRRMVKRCLCVRCGHEWWPNPNNNGRPERCARCKVKFWWRLKRVKKEVACG